MTLKELRISKKLTQKNASELLEVPLRTYLDYENKERRKGSVKYRYFYEKLAEVGFTDEEHGILDLKTIEAVCGGIFNKYGIDYGLLFGSYAKHSPNEKSDIDLVIPDTVNGLEFYGLVEELRQGLRKKVDLITVRQLQENKELLEEVLRFGLKIVGKNQG